MCIRKRTIQIIEEADDPLGRGHVTPTKMVLCFNVGIRPWFQLCRAYIYSQRCPSYKYCCC